jgi:phosphopantetheinyl transferase (holo-ACP synthase)
MYVAAIARDVDVGVDIESRHRPLGNVTALANRWFHPAEANLVDGNPELFLDTWTQKEAFVKASGRGIGHGGLRGFQITAEGLVVVDDEILTQWSLQSFKFAESSNSRADEATHVGCVAMEHTGAQVTNWFSICCDDLLAPHLV